MLINPLDLSGDLDRLEEIERASLRLVTQALYNYRATAQEIFQEESDLAADIGEDITREALDRLGMSQIDQRLFGKVDYKRACYLFHPDYAIKQALFVDSKAEKVSGQRTATLQTSQLSLSILQIRAGQEVRVPGRLPTVITVKGDSYLTTTLFVKYNYAAREGKNELRTITVAALPNGMLQQKYNPAATDNIWGSGRDSPKRKEKFRVRLSFPKLKGRANWRVQKIPMPPHQFVWDA